MGLALLVQYLMSNYCIKVVLEAMGVNEMKVEEEGKELWMESFWIFDYLSDS